MDNITLLAWILVPILLANSWQIDSQPISKENFPVKLLGPTECMLQHQVIELNEVNVNQKQGLYYYPPCVTVTRCAGCCKANSYVLSQLYMCQPDQVDHRWVMQFAQTIGKRPDGTVGIVIKRRRVSVEVHFGCKCRCRYNPAGVCLLANQTFNEENCNCHCDVAQTTKNECNSQLTQFGYKFWDEMHCQCQCPQFFTIENKNPKTPVCATFYHFNHTICACQRSE